jgi:SNF2 family DNA or RNA helicase
VHTNAKAQVARPKDWPLVGPARPGQTQPSPACAGKLQQLAKLLSNLKTTGSRCLIFTQMSKMLDILEAFLNIHGYVYMRLDGSTKPAERQALMTRFNAQEKYFVFILSTRSGGVGINLTGANCVIFYDSDWNPAMDQQAQVCRGYTGAR